MINQPGNVYADSMKFTFRKSFCRDYNTKIKKAQRTVDSECLRLIAPYWWRDQGVSYGRLLQNTKVGSGLIHSGAVYDHRHNVHPNFNFQGAPMRGAYPFRRMKIDNKKAIRKKAGEVF